MTMSQAFDSAATPTIDPEARKRAAAATPTFGRALFAQPLVPMLTAATVVALVLYLVGRPQWVTTTGAKVSAVMPGSPETGGMNVWIAAHYDLLRIGAVAIALLALFLIGFGIVALLVIGALLALVLWWLAGARDRAVAEPEVVAVSDPEQIEAVSDPESGV